MHPMVVCEWISQHLDMHETQQGFCVTIPDEALNAEKESSTMAVYKCHVEKVLIYSDSFEKIDFAFVPLNPTFENVGRTKIDIRVGEEICYKNIKVRYSGTDSIMGFSGNDDLSECA